MDLNLSVLAGKMACEPEVKTFASGAVKVRMLVTVRSSEPRQRIDVIPVVLWDPDPDTKAELFDMGPVRGRGVWVAGAIQRKFWSGEAGTTSRIEIVAHQVKVRFNESDDGGDTDER